MGQVSWLPLQARRQAGQCWVLGVVPSVPCVKEQAASGRGPKLGLGSMAAFSYSVGAKTRDGPSRQSLFLPTAPHVDTSSQPQSSAGSTKRPWSTAFSNSGSDSETEVTTEMQGIWPRGCRASWPRRPTQRCTQSTEPTENWAVEWLLGLKMRLKKQRVSTVLPEHHKVFNRLLGRA